MKRKIAVFANAWSMKNLSDALVGIKECAKEKDMDVFIFLSHAAPGNSEDEMREEKRIYQLPDLADFDAAIVFSASMNFMDLVLGIRDRAIQAGIPAVSVGIRIEGMGYVGTDHEDSMCELVEHLVTEHQVRTIRFMAGPKGHEHSELRIAGTRKVFEKHGIPFHEEDIFYSDWSASVAAAEVKRILTDQNASLPDAIICANDTLAMPVCIQIEKHGYKVPDDVIVTGFDDSFDGQVFYPAIATVGQSDYELGKYVFRSVWEAIQGNPTEEFLLKSYFVANESCGCHSDKTDVSRRQVCQNYFPDKVEDIKFGWGNKWLSEMILSAENISQIKTNLNNYLAQSESFYRTSYFLQDMTAGEYLEGKEIDKNSPGYSEELKVWASANAGKIIPCDKISRRELIPGYKKEEGVTHMYMFLPLHFETCIFGYLVLDDWMEGIESGKIKVFMDSLNMNLDKLKQNMVLENLNARLR
ncbi:MAG: substrate-binding domain-containing protein, partial [Clostridiales bacterium]|nr:substrate-binding domain-containing protein [Candidatus Blautia equi]